MKKFLLIILYFLPLTISAQTEEGVIPSDTTYFPPGTWWIKVEDKGAGYDYYSGYINMVSDESQVYNNRVYYKIKYTFSETPKDSYIMGSLEEMWRGAPIWIHEKDNKVYIKRSVEYLTYDFSDEAWEIGDTLPSFDFPIAHLGEIELLDGTICKTWDYEGWNSNAFTNPATTGMLIQGIGHVGNLGIVEWGSQEGGPTWGTRPGYELHSFFRRGQRIYKNPKFTFDLAEYIPANINSASDNSTANSAIYDLSGRKLTEKPQKGFYIQGGRKYIAR